MCCARLEGDEIEGALMDRKALFEFVFSPFVFFHLVLAGRALFFTTLEVLRPARALSYRSVAPRDLLALVAYINIVFPLAGYLNYRLHGNPSYAIAAVSELPLPVRFALYL